MRIEYCDLCRLDKSIHTTLHKHYQIKDIKELCSDCNKRLCTEILTAKDEVQEEIINPRIKQWLTERLAISEKEKTDD